MTEVEATATLVAMGDTHATYISMWVTATFAYLTVAYLVGRDLSGFQSVAVSGLYIASASLFAIAAVGHAEAWVSLAGRVQTTYDTITASQIFPIWTLILSLFFLAGTLVSLYFMYNVRHTEKA
jgi:hypothetical protein